jgi:nucleoside-diphosphate-sugar epimerase
MIPPPASVLLVGSGYLGRRIVTRLLEQGIEVTATSTRLERLDEIRSLGAEPLRLDLATVDATTIGNRRWESVIVAVAPGSAGDAELVYHEGPTRLRAALVPPPSRFVYVSSTGVYAQDRGEIIDEDSIAANRSGSSGPIRTFEERLLGDERCANGIVIRIAGLYGPGRSPIDWLRNPPFRARLGKGGEAYMNWIHVDDAASGVAAAAVRGEPGRVYLLSDGRPVKRRDFYEEAARLGATPPPIFSNDADRGKRIDPRRTLEELEIFLRYPDHSTGLASIAQNNGT